MILSNIKSKKLQLKGQLKGEERLWKDAHELEVSFFDEDVNRCK